MVLAPRRTGGTGILSTAWQVILPSCQIPRVALVSVDRAI
ncbi:hypothetical protein AB395_00006347 (plasmid) [Sinorhizobium fredii CCBAU 45436]|nr:hypothetical protein AB395_00006347 [Sinorhizobium fredii CCBAU 45436]